MDWFDKFNDVIGLLGTLGEMMINAIFLLERNVVLFLAAFYDVTSNEIYLDVSESAAGILKSGVLMSLLHLTSRLIAVIMCAIVQTVISKAIIVFIK
jgi:hypothetical protein